ncbi:TRC8 ring finger protein [Carabus blaptoides fortunei]
MKCRFGLKFGLGLSEFSEQELSDFANIEVTSSYFSNYSTAYIAADPLFYRYVLISLTRLTLGTLGCIAALCLFILCTKHLMIVYTYLTSVGIVFISYWTNLSTAKAVLALTPEIWTTSILEDVLSLNVQRLLEPTSPGSLILQNATVQCILAFIFCNIHMGPKQSVIHKLLPLSFMVPSILFTLPLPASILTHSPVFSSLLPLATVTFVLWSSVFYVIHTLYAGYQHAKNMITNFGMSALVETEWVRLNVPSVLRTFWILRVLEHTGLFFFNGDWNFVDANGLTPVFRLIKTLMVTGCETLTAVLGMTSIVSYICHHIGRFFQWVLLTEDEDDKSIGTVSAILFYILALQTGLTSLEPEKRFVRLCRNFCLLFTALLHFIHNIVNPLLMSLSASHNPSVRRHLRALSVCAFLVLFPVGLLVWLWTHHEASTWLLAVSAFSIEVIVKVTVSLMIYTLFLLDARRETFWERLDDYVYYIRAFGNTVEFFFGIFLFFNGAWILVFESGGAIRAVMMCIHAYFNIWCEAKAGWSVFMKRRTAVNKIESLPEAQAEQLEMLNDVCAICYQEMQTAKITKCKHFFHGVCLRKWLYVQDRCPLCHKILHSVDSDEPKEEVQPLVLDEDQDDYR